MASLIFWFIVLIFIISSVVKGKKKPANRNRNDTKLSGTETADTADSGTNGEKTADILWIL